MFGLNKKVVICCSVALLLIIGAAIIIVVTLQYEGTSESSASFDQWEPKLVSNSPLGRYQRAAVSSNGVNCSEIAGSMLRKNGTAVDAAIAALLCEGVSSLHSMGLGGGFLMTIWDSDKKEAVFLDARETAPAAAHRDMYKNDPQLSFYGGLAIAVPGELAGYWAAHQRYGRLPWRDLFEPTIVLCNEGIVINEYLADSLRKKAKLIKEQPSLAEILINPITGTTWGVGDKLYRPKLNETLRLIADHGIDIFYNGTIGMNLIREIEEMGGILTMNDLRDYRVRWRTPVKAQLGELTMYSAPPPGSGAVLALIMNVLEKFVPTADEGTFWQRMIETFKWGYARRTDLGDEDFEDVGDLISNFTSETYADDVRKKISDNWTSNDPEYYGVKLALPDDSGTSHVSVLAADGSAVSVTSTINQVLGAMRRSPSTGIIFNDEMDDFSTPGQKNGFNLPPSPANFIKPGKRPMSSMVPTIVVDKENEVQLVIGAAGGTKITSAVSLAMALNLFSGYNIKEALNARRIHHQLLPMSMEVEPGFSHKILDHLKNVGHNMTYYSGIGSALTAISRLGHQGITANSDYRRQGGIDGI